MEARQAIAIMRDNSRKIYGTVQFIESYIDGPLIVRVSLADVPTGYHGFHLHEFGNDFYGPESFGSHYNPTHMHHGSRNDPHAHVGDFGNLFANSDRDIDDTFTANLITYDEIIGRGLVLHEDIDDLGFGNHPDSSTTGHSGHRMLWGVVAVNGED